MRPDVTILASLHLLFVLLSSLPGENPFLERYQWLTNTVQNWRMFHSAYTFRDQEFLATSDRGYVVRAAPPRYLDSEDGDRLPIRLINYLGRVRNPGNEVAKRAWIERLSGVMAKSGADSYTVTIWSRRIRNFYYSRQDGVLFKDFEETFGPFALER